MPPKAGETFTDAELEGLSDEERAMLEEGDGAEDLEKIAKEGEDDAGDDKDGDEKDGDDKDGEDDRSADEKAADELKAKEEEERARKAKSKSKDDEGKDDADAEGKDKDGEGKQAKKGADDGKDKDDAGKDDADGKEEEAGAEAAAEEDDDPYVPPYVAPAPENYEQRIKDLDARLESAEKKFKDGTEGYELADLLKDQRAIERERRDLELQMERHRVTSEQAEKAGERHWQWEVNRFMRDVKKHEGIDYADSIRLNNALDTEVKALASKPENADKSGQWFLREAHKVVKAKLKIGDAAPAKDGKGAKKDDAAAKAEAERKAKEKAARERAEKSGKDKAPKTLGGLPAAGGADLGKDGEGEFSEAQALLDKGDSIALEAYIAGKSPEWQDRWARHS